jgi:hypothetical protein
MTERSVAQVVQHTCCLSQILLLGKQIEDARHLAGHMAHTHHVISPCVHATGVAQKTQTELTDPLQSLQLRQMKQ